MLRRFVWVRALAIVVSIIAPGACAAAPNPAISNKRAASSTDLPALFAPLFRSGASWSFTADTRVGGTDQKPGAVTCAIKTTRTLAHAWLADFACTGIVADQPIDGVLVATVAGLWHVDRPIAEITDDVVAQLAPTSMSVAATPVLGDHTNQLSTSEQETYSVMRGPGESWCFNYSTNQGDDRGWTLCIDAAKGIVGGMAFWSGNVTTTTTFGSQPRP